MNGKYWFKIPFLDAHKGNRDVAHAHLLQELLAKGWSKSTIDISQNETGLELVLYDEAAGNILCFDDDDDEVEDGDLFIDDSEDDEEYEDDEIDTDEDEDEYDEESEEDGEYEKEE